MNRDKCKVVRVRIDEALKALGEELNIKFEATSASFTDSNVTYKLVCSEIASNGQVETPERTAYTNCCFMYGMKPEWLDTVFRSHDGSQYKIVGLKTKAKKYPIIGKDVISGRRYKFPAEMVKRSIEEANMRRQSLANQT